MIRIYRSKKSERRASQAITWLDIFEIDYNILSKKELSKGVLLKMLSLCESGFNDILIPEQNGSKECKKIYCSFNMDKISTNQMIEVILKYPIILKSPIIFNEEKLMTGFNSDDIRMFIPRERKIQYFNKEKIRVNKKSSLYIKS